MPFHRPDLRLFILRVLVCALCVAAGNRLAAQDTTPTSAPNPAASDPDPERWNLYYQATSIGQTHPAFYSPYQGPLSLLPHPEAEASLTTTLFFGLRLFENTQLYFDPEIAGGRGFSNTNGIANFPNGEIPRVAAATPTPYLARLYITQDIGFGDKRELVESDENQLAGSRPMVRYSITVGRFSLEDFFDNNRYSHDPRTQFEGWATMYNGAWDYPADTRGYTWGWVHEFHTRRWSFRYGSAAMPLRRQRQAIRPPHSARPRRRLGRRAPLPLWRPRRRPARARLPQSVMMAAITPPRCSWRIRMSRP